MEEDCDKLQFFDSDNDTNTDSNCNIPASAVAVGEAFLSPEYYNIRVTSSASASAEGCTLEEAQQKALEIAQNVANSVAKMMQIL